VVTAAIVSQVLPSLWLQRQSHCGTSFTKVRVANFLQTQKFFGFDFFQDL